MRAAVGIFYWVVVALLALNAVYVSVAESRLWAGLLVPAALLVTRFLADQIVGMDWSCSEVAFDGISNPSGGTFGCTVVSIDLVLFGLCMWAMALLGVFLLRRRPRPGNA
jgi:hypothetical protein